MADTADFATFQTLMAQSGLTLTEAQLRAVYEGYGPLQAMLARVNKALPREAEPALTFDPEDA
jgi:hypothetical protein